MSASEKKPVMSDGERQELIRKMDEDLNDFIESRKATHKEATKDDAPYDKTVDKLVAELKVHPAFMTEFDPTQEMSPEMEGLQQLKYESDSAEVNADSYKDDGNYNFQKKKYRWAIDSYTKGITEKCRNRLLNAILYSNRAAAHYHLGNYRSSFTDSLLARKFKTDHIKAIYRGAQCLVHLKQFGQSLKWCDDGLLFDPKDEKFLELRTKAGTTKKQHERDERKAALKERKVEEQQCKLIETIKVRGIQLAMTPGNQTDHHRILSSLETHHPSGCQVHVDTQGVLQWPVMFVYPEYTLTDLIEAFSEHSRLSEHVVAMFGDQVEPPSWDEEHKYKPHNIQVYFEDRKTESLFPVDMESTLAETLQHKRYIVHGGTPSFILLVKDSPFAKHFLVKYKS